jgi:hypothetical protein
MRSRSTSWQHLDIMKNALSAGTPPASQPVSEQVNIIEGECTVYLHILVPASQPVLVSDQVNIMEVIFHQEECILITTTCQPASR